VIEVMLESMREFARAFGRGARDGEVIEEPGVVACVTPRLGAHSLFNAALLDDVALLPRLASRYEAAGVEAWGVWVHESEAEKRDALAEFGLVLDSSPTAMARGLDESLVPPSGASVEPLHDLDVFDEVESAAWDFPPGALADGMPGVVREFRCYLARAGDGAPGAIVGTLHHRGDCGVTLVATTPAARGRGLATAAMLHALREAFADGCTTTTLQATAPGRPIYRRLGYEEFGTAELWEMRRHQVRP
jgi:GNAT superfamily N-acetyltransferase